MTLLLKNLNITKTHNKSMHQTRRGSGVSTTEPGALVMLNVLCGRVLKKEAIGGRLMKELIKKRNLFMSTTIMCVLLTIAFSFDSIGIHWFWSGNIPVAIVLGVLAIILGTFWFRTQRKIKEFKN